MKWDTLEEEPCSLARTVAVIARAVSEDQAVELIEQYARTFACFAAREATERACEKIRIAILTTMNAPRPPR